MEELEERLPGFEQHLKLHVTGCPNSCGQHWIADIGIEGKKIKVDGRQQDAYYFCVGGAVGLAPVGGASHRLSLPGQRSAGRHRAPSARYLDERSPDENLRHYFARRSDDELRECLAGKFLPAVERDLRRERCRMRWKVRRKRELENNRNVILSAASPFACEWTGGVEGPLAASRAVGGEGLFYEVRAARARS